LQRLPLSVLVSSSLLLSSYFDDPTDIYSHGMRRERGTEEDDGDHERKEEDDIVY
jgi:hypothetical protein